MTLQSFIYVAIQITCIGFFVPSSCYEIQPFKIVSESQPLKIASGAQLLISRTSLEASNEGHN
jgi:hypothetical protein